jgi:HEAT repeat protein
MSNQPKNQFQNDANALESNAFNLAEWDDDTPALAPPRFSPGDLLDQLMHQAETVTDRDLFAFSDLSLRDAELVRQQWPLVPVERRRTVIRHLVDLAVDELDLHLNRILRIAMQDSDAAVRQTAITGLWEETESDLLGPLIEVMRRDENEQVRAAAAATLGNYVLAGELDELDAALAMRAEQALLEVLRNEDEPLIVQSRALESLAYSGEAGIRQLIENAYYSPYEALRVSSLAAMGRSADVHWRTYARAELMNPSAAMRAEAARACGELEVKSAARDLLQLLADEEQSVRLAAIFALGRVGGRDARTALRAIGDEGDEIEAKAADDALEEMMFYADERNGISLFDDDDDAADDDDEPWDKPDDEDLGEYAR